MIVYIALMRLDAKPYYYDFLIIGAGINGLTLAYELVRKGHKKIGIIEKEKDLGAHASGRNSGVVHAGIYYATDSLKAKFCVEGHRRMIDFVESRKLPILKCGKVITSTQEKNVPVLDTLFQRANANGVTIEKISLQKLKALEPEAFSYDHALFSPKTAVIDSHAVLSQLKKELSEAGVQFHFEEKISEIDSAKKIARSEKSRFSYGFLINAAGAYADQIAHLMNVGLRYKILPFKGLYWKSSEEFSKRIRCLIYPVPDINFPFLGVHITKKIDGTVMFGPTAIPAFGRENYSILGGLDLKETPVIGWNLLKMLLKNNGHFRHFVKEELFRYIPRYFYEETKSLVPNLQKSDIAGFGKVGIRAQLMDLKEQKLEMDFIIETGPDSIHILNAISPAFTSSFACAEHVIELVDGSHHKEHESVRF